MPRDPARISPFCNQLAAMWAAVPDLRFGQFALNVFEFIKNDCGSDPFYMEDEEMICKFQEYICERATLS